MPKNRPAVRVIGPSIAYLPLANDRHCLIDADDADFLQRFAWHTIEQNGRAYARNTKFLGKGKYQRTLLHKMLLPSDQITDHINENSLDNRRSNLRVVTTRQNNLNRRVSTASMTGIKNVTRLPSGNYYVYFIIDRKHHAFGSYRDREAAIRRAQQVREQLHGEFACHR